MRAYGPVIAILLGGLLMQPAAAEPRLPRAHLQAPSELRSASISPREAAQRAESKYGGKALAVDPQGAGFRVKLLKGGDVHTVYISP